MSYYREYRIITAIYVPYRYFTVVLRRMLSHYTAIPDVAPLFPIILPSLPSRLQLPPDVFLRCFVSVVFHCLPTLYQAVSWPITSTTAATTLVVVFHFQPNHFMRYLIAERSWQGTPSTRVPLSLLQFVWFAGVYVFCVSFLVQCLDSLLRLAICYLSLPVCNDRACISPVREEAARTLDVLDANEWRERLWRTHTPLRSLPTD